MERRSLKKIRIEILIYCLCWQLAAILYTWKVSDRVGSYTFSGKKFDDFSRIFPDPTLIYINLTPTKQMFVLKAMFWVSTRSHAEKPDNARGAWKHMQTRHSLCIRGSMDMCESNERAMGKKKSLFTHFVRISRILFSEYLNICFHLL